MDKAENHLAGNETILGLDLGTNSVGWCLLSARDGQPTGVIALGVRVFEAGMEGDIASGKGESRGLQRRQARQQRRMTERRARRKRKVLHVLQSAGLLPPGSAGEVVPQLDAEFLPGCLGDSGADERHQRAQVLPYWLRKEALDRPLAPYELGRAFYHLAQRRGYRSNRKTLAKDAKEKGQVEAEIAEIRSAMEASGARTLGEYLAASDPEERRIRQRWTARGMYLDEFDAIWDAQAPHHAAVLTPEFRKDLHQAIFYQRPLRSAAGLVGTCTLEPDRKRAPLALLCAQRFRLLCQVNHCNVIPPPPARRARGLTTEERDRLVEALERDGDLTFTRAKDLVGLSRRAKFGFEEGGEKRFVGNRTNAALAKVFGERWWDLSSDDQQQVVEDLRSFEKADALASRGMRRWGLGEEAARKLALVTLELGYSNHSRAAIGKLLPALERGAPYTTAVRSAYGETGPRTEVHDLLPPVTGIGDLRNPVVCRVLTELRKVVNLLVRRYGKPTQVRIELARDLRRAKKQRQAASKKIRANEQAREAARRRVLDETAVGQPGPDDLLKVLLAEECNWQCPFTGRRISMANLVGENPSFDIEHIIPFSRCLDDSYINKTLCYHEENRHRKGNRTPWEAYGSTPAWEEIVARVSRFKGDAAAVKVRRFQTPDEELESLQDFTNRQLSDTRYASRLAMDYLSLLHGGAVDATGRRRVQAGRGQVTRYVRQALGLNRILGDGPGKSRHDHRHHAVDAFAIALTDAKLVKRLSDAAVRAFERRGKRRHFEPIPDPWPGFFTDLCDSVDATVTSHRPHRRINGPLHKDTYYAKVETRDPQTGRTRTTYHVRKELRKLSKRDVDNIVDPAVRAIVKRELAARKLLPPKAFADRDNDPVILPRKPGARAIPIHRVRVRCAINPVAVGDPDVPRHVMTDTNHHLEVVAVLDDQGQETKWEGHLVSRLEALRRVRAKQPVVQRDHGPKRRFKLCLAPGDMIRLANSEGAPELAVVRSVSIESSGRTRVEFVDVNDARKGQDIKKAQAWYKPATNTLAKRRCRKVTASPLGELELAND